MSNFYKVKITVKILTPNSFESSGYKSTECYLSINTISKSPIIGHLVCNEGGGDEIRVAIRGLEFLRSYTLNEDLLKIYDSNFEDYLMGNFTSYEIEEIIEDNLTVGPVESATGDELFNYHILKYSGTRKEEHEKTYIVDSEDSFCVFDPAEETDEDLETPTIITDRIIKLPQVAIVNEENLFHCIEGIRFTIKSMEVIRQFHLEHDLWYYAVCIFGNEYLGNEDQCEDLSSELEVELDRLNIQWKRNHSLDSIIND